MKKYYAVSGMSGNIPVVDIYENISEDDAELVAGYCFDTPEEAEQFERKFNLSSFGIEKEIDDFYQNLKA